jgi:predicted ATP-grasp superfamily ATP-dependent carboligase
MRKAAIAGKVLVLGADNRSGLATIRSLGRGGIKVHAASHRHDPATLRSRYLHRAHTIPAYSEADAGWKTALTGLMKQEQFDLVLPTNDMWVTALQRHRADLEHLGCVYLLNNRVFEVLFDKLKTNVLARSLGIPIPYEVVISRVEEVAEAAAICGFPIVLKPARSLNELEGGPRHVVRKASSEMELRQHVHAMLQFGPIAAQRFFVGRGVGVELLLHDGEPLLIFQHERVHEAFGSGSSYRKGVALSSHLVEASLTILRHVAYTGVAMVEFRVNPDSGEWMFIEVNARFWGSLPLALASGADFPLALYRFLTEGKTDIPQTYREGLYCRNLTMDLPWYCETFRAGHRDHTSSRRPLVRDCVDSLANVMRLRERVDTLALDDPMPFVAELARLGETYSGPIRARLRRRRSSAVGGTASLEERLPG